jgi:hypothetical protein
METKKFICGCCGKESEIPVNNEEFEVDYTTLINSRSEFFDLVDMCPECGYVSLFDNEISDEMKEFVESEEYREIVSNQDIETGLKKWILLAMLSELDENYTEAAIEYMKVYDYLELKEIPLDDRFIKKATECFLIATDENHSFMDAFFAVDCLRRDGEFQKAKSFLQVIKDTFEGEQVDRLIEKEKIWIEIQVSEKGHFDI